MRMQQQELPLGERPRCVTCGKEMPKGTLVGPTPAAWGVQNTHSWEPTRTVSHRYFCPDCKTEE